MFRGSLEPRFASTPLVHQLCATLGELASMRWRKGACARCGGELTPDPPPRPSCEASVTAPLFWRWSCFHKPHRGGKRGVGLAWLMPKLVFFLPRHTAPGTLCLRVPCSSPSPQCGAGAWGALCWHVTAAVTKPERVTRSELLNSCLEVSS